MTIIFGIGRNKFAILVKRGLFCVIIFKQQKKEMKNLFLISILTFLLASCEKETVVPNTNTFTPNLSGKAKDVNDIVWGVIIDRRAQGSNYIQFGETISFTNTTVATADIVSFDVQAAKSYTATIEVDELTGQGVAYTGSGYKVTVVDMDDPDDHYPPYLAIKCYQNGTMLMSMGYSY